MRSSTPGGLLTIFEDYTVDQIYDIYKTKRAAIEGKTEGDERDIANFSFLVIDKECINSNPRQCLVCTDAPDWDENPKNDTTIEPKLKVLRLSIEDAMSCLLSLELLLVTPSELLRADGITGSVMPEPFWMPIGDERIPGALFKDSRAATPAEARANKRLSLALDLSVLDDRAHTIMEAPLQQCKRVALVYRGALETRWQMKQQYAVALKEESLGIPEEDRQEFLPGSISIYFGDAVCAYASHLEYRLDVYPESSRKVTTYKIRKDDA